LKLQRRIPPFRPERPHLKYDLKIDLFFWQYLNFKIAKLGCWAIFHENIKHFEVIFDTLMNF